MLENNEEKMVKKYSILLKIALVSVIMSFLIEFIWLILVMINEVFLYGDTSMGTLYVSLGIAGFYLVLFSYGMLCPRFGMLRKPWKDILRKVSVKETDFVDYNKKLDATISRSLGNISGNENLKVVGVVSTIDSVSDSIFKINNHIQEVASLAGVQVPKARKYVIPLVLIPILLLAGLFIPQYIESYKNLENERILVSKSVYAIRDVLEEKCEDIFIDDPNEKYWDYGYNVRGYIRDFDSSENSSINVTVGNGGVIEDVNYSIDIDIEKSKEENLTIIEKNICELSGILNEVNVSVVDSVLLNTYELPDGFIEKFIENSYYDEFSETFIDDMGTEIYISFDTDTKEEFDEHSEPYVYYSIHVNG